MSTPNLDEIFDMYTSVLNSGFAPDSIMMSGSTCEQMYGKTIAELQAEFPGQFHEVSLEDMGIEDDPEENL